MLKVVDVVDGDWQAAGVIVHDETNRAVAHMLVEMPFGGVPGRARRDLRRSRADLRERGGRAELRRPREGQDAPICRS